MTLLRLFAGVAILALCGCGSTAPTPTQAPEAKASGQELPEKQMPKASPTELPLLPEMPGPALLGPTDPVQKLAEEFIADLRGFAEKPGNISDELRQRLDASFLQIIGKPLLTDADKKLGYSLEAASAWLRRAGMQLTGIGLPTGYGSPVAAAFTGTFGNGAGRFLIRFNLASGSKVDWFSLGTIKTPLLMPTSSDAAFLDFAGLAFLDALTSTAMSKDDRLLLFGGILTPKLKQSWAPPSEQDKSQGYGFNPAQLGMKLDELGKGVTAFAIAPAGNNAYKVELTKGSEKKAYTLKLVKGSTPGAWLVEEFQ
ncbi:MAG TPA: hypothetical protein VN641_07280 [Urbifossiella sp.]|nr:hypothetical protein [Urbifossiella sp.]